jgi:hypothetical protein
VSFGCLLGSRVASIARPSRAEAVWAQVRSRACSAAIVCSVREASRCRRSDERSRRAVPQAAASLARAQAPALPCPVILALGRSAHGSLCCSRGMLSFNGGRTRHFALHARRATIEGACPRRAASLADRGGGPNRSVSRAVGVCHLRRRSRPDGTVCVLSAGRHRDLWLGIHLTVRPSRRSAPAGSAYPPSSRRSIRSRSRRRSASSRADARFRKPGSSCRGTPPRWPARPARRTRDLSRSRAPIA